MKLSSALLLVGLVGEVGMDHLAAQVGPVLPIGESPDATIALIEAEGRAFQPAQGGHDFSDAFDDLPWTGTSERHCVRANADGNFRSGEFFIGTRLTALREGKEGKVWWEPVKQFPEMELLVRGRHLGSPSDSIRFVNSGWVLFTNRPKLSPDRPHNGMFPGGLTLPRRGSWVIVGTSGPNWGCFVLEVSG